MPKVTPLKKNPHNPLANLTTAGLVAAVSNRLFGNMSLLYGNTEGALSNRKDFLQNSGVDYRNLICAIQIHSSRIEYVQEKELGMGALSAEFSIPDTDALVTDKRGLPLAVFTADCLSVFLYDPITPAVGLVHAGWRGTKDNILSRAVGMMRERFNTNTSSLYAGFGPAIRGCCYEVSADFEAFFPGELTRKGSRYYLDLAQVNRKQALGLGVSKENIFDPLICTSCRNEEFFSYRKEGSSCGRMMSVVMLK